jgi:hypothetical protein
VLPSWFIRARALPARRAGGSLISRGRARLIIPGPKQPLETYADESSGEYDAMVQLIGKKIGVTSLRYQQLPKMIKAIGLPQEKVCTYCWTGKSKGIPSSS